MNVKKSLKFDSIQHIHDHIWFIPNGFDRTKYQGPFGMDKMSYGCFGQDQTSANHRKSLILIVDYEIGTVLLASLHTQGSWISNLPMATKLA